MSLSTFAAAVITSEPAKDAPSVKQKPLAEMSACFHMSILMSTNLVALKGCDVSGIPTRTYQTQPC